MKLHLSEILQFIRGLDTTDWIALTAATIAMVSLFVSWRTAIYQRKIDNDRELLRQLILTLERAYLSISPNDPTALPLQNRLGWLTAARHIATFKTLKTELKTQLHKTLCEEHEEYWRHQFYVLLTHINNCAYFEWKNGTTGASESIDPTSAALVFAFSNWPKGRKDRLADFSLKELIQDNDLFSPKFIHFKNYIESRCPHLTDGLRDDS